MREALQFYIDGQWTDPVEPGRTIDVINPATEQPMGRIAMGSAAGDKDKVVADLAEAKQRNAALEGQLAAMGTAAGDKDKLAADSLMYLGRLTISLPEIAPFDIDAGLKAVADALSRKRIT